MRFIKQLLITLGLVASFSLVPVSVGAIDVFTPACNGVDTALCKDRTKDQAPSFIKTLINTMLYVLGAVSVIVIIFAGIFYTTSIGDSNIITKAKNTLLYAVIGLIVALMAYAIVNFVLVSLIK